MNKVVIILLFLLFVAGCCHPEPTDVHWPAHQVEKHITNRETSVSSAEASFIAAGLIDVATLDSSILVDLRYSGTDNFMGVDFYQGLNKCYLQEPVARMLVKAQHALKLRHPDLTLMVWDAARPQWVQAKMWSLAVPPPGIAKGFFVSNPARGSLHNFGCAVDVTIANLKGEPLDMGTDFDFFGPEAHPVQEQRLLKDGKLTEMQVTNRILLRSVMAEGGFWNIQTEWWHFNAMRREVASRQFRMIR
jgi:zinc D-Ala-D-Ala dipeptidase